MKIIYFDICAIPLFLMILFVCQSRRMTRGNANQLFITLVLLSLFSALADLGMEIADNAAPLSEAGRLACGVCTYVYLTLRNATNAVLLLFLLELTKTTFETVSEIVLENIAELVRMGYSFALDDYGTGYSSIQRVTRLPLRLVKIDKSMLDESSTDNGRKILEHTVHMLQSIGKKLVAEGAETREAVDMLRDMNCDYIQGYYYSRPLPADEFVRFLKEHGGTDA
ncbi:MAG: EAL domain-containing protein [Eubacteriales bacterium]|nr:EAL domain-containing protein [Eubacteriales bacterium]